MKILTATGRLIALLVMLLPATATVAADDVVTRTTSLGEGLYLFRYGEQQSIFLIGTDGVIATDPLSKTAAKAYKKAIAEVSDEPITHVVYTNSFFDRVPGGKQLGNRKTEYVAQENCKANLQATPHPDAKLPTLTYSDALSLDAGDASLDLYYFGQSYGTCLSVVIAKPANIMFIHGLVTPPAAKVPDDPTIANYYLHNLIPVFVYIEELAAREGVEQVVGSVVVDGGEPLAPVALIAEQREFWDTLLRIVEVEYNKGTPARAIPKKADMSPLADYPGYDPQHIEIMMRRIYSLYRIGR